MTSDGDPDNPRDWCVLALEHLAGDRAEAALDAARAAERLDPAGEWAHRLISAALQRLGRDLDALPDAREAVRLAPGSWHARLRLASVLRRLPGQWDEAVMQAELAGLYAPEEPDPHVLTGDLALLRGDHAAAERSYLAALALRDDHPAARVNLGLTRLRWDRPKTHHDPAWPVDPRETGRARRALEVWTRQARLLTALATALVGVATLVLDRGMEARLGGFLALLLLAGVTVRQARAVGSWSFVPAMLGRDPWLGAAVASTVVALVAYVAWLLLPVVPPGDLTPVLDPLWAGLAGIVLFGWPALAGVRVLAETWRGRPLPALTQFTRAYGERTARRDVGVTLWIVLCRAWTLLVLVVGVAFLAGPRLAVLALGVPYLLVGARRRARPVGDRWLVAAALLLVLACVACTAGGLLGLAVAWRAGLIALAAVGAVFVVRAVRAWWRGAPGPWRPSLAMVEDGGDGDLRPPAGLSPEVRQAFAYARGVVLAYADDLGPRTMAVGAVTSVSSNGQLRLIAGEEAWAAVERDPRVAVFAADPLQRRFWVEVRGIAVADADMLRVTPKTVVVGEYPGRHQRR
ncbi:tetratricopeptide repeat protein [Nonomuraea sp. NPDC050556]|uniref:tetratricopeptide repeat protein n=1 Tax=Nonomuraea sp. NPDC050556 TaxID=3364369 RepID=UPI0037A180B0